MRQSLAALAIIQRTHAGEREWLAQWNERWRCFHLIGGHKQTDESFRQCIVREIDEELQLAEGLDYLVAEQPLRRVEYTAWSRGTRQMTRYTMELFEVQFTRDTARHNVDANRLNRWLTEEEIRTRQCVSGEQVGESVELLLTKAKLLGGRTD